MSKIKALIKSLLAKNFGHKTSVKIISLPQTDWLSGRCALITGGTSGIGFSIAEAYIKAGAIVIISGRSQERIDEALNRLPSGRKYGFVLDNCNVSSFDPTFQSMLDVLHKDNVPFIDMSYTRWGNIALKA